MVAKSITPGDGLRLDEQVFADDDDQHEPGADVLCAPA